VGNKIALEGSSYAGGFGVKACAYVVDVLSTIISLHPIKDRD